MTIKDLNPQLVWKNFYELTQIPRPSKKEAKVVEFTKAFGEKLGLNTVIDEIGNVIIKKPATAGMENRKTIVLQSHLDMVPQKNNDVAHDFEKDPIQAYVDGEWVTAKGTTLGADNGIGVAAIMAVLEDKSLKHGPIEALLTIDEETGMTGAFGLKPGYLDGDILLNLDSEDEGELYIGCAGGVDANVTMKYDETNVAPNSKAFRLTISGLQGGHSGLDIHLGRGNANKIITRILYKAATDLDAQIAEINGGSLRNAIPRDAYSIFTVTENNANKLQTLVDELTAIITKELSVVEPKLSIKLEATDMPKKVMDKASQTNMLKAIYGCPNGVIRMSDSMPGIVETSTNLAVVKSENGKIEILNLLRSSVDTAKKDLTVAMESVFTLAGGEVVFEGEYPGWKPNPDSEVLTQMKEVYNKMYNKVPEIKVIHAGLECGIIGAVYTKLDMISFGPTIRYPHSPDEKVNIATVQKFWDYLVKTLEEVPEK